MREKLINIIKNYYGEEQTNKLLALYDELIAENSKLQAQVYAYEKIIANSNFNIILGDKE